MTVEREFRLQALTPHPQSGPASPRLFFFELGQLLFSLPKFRFPLRLH